MPVPKKRTSHSKRNMRRSHHALMPGFSIVCPKCGAAQARHRACPECGTYRGKQIVPEKTEPVATPAA
jgi:large subunit ribosomal protein L32